MAERWKTMLGRVPEIEPDLERLRSLALDGPRLPDPPTAGPERRIAIASFAMAVAVAAVALVFVALREQPQALPAGEHDPADPLVESGGTYLLSDFDLTFPVQSDAPGNDGLYAEVRFHTEWSTATWPGEAHCEFRLLDRAGGVVASETMGFSIDGPESDRARVAVEVPTDAEKPVGAEGDCGPGMVFDGSSHYVFSDLRIEGGDLVGDVAWSAGTPVGYAACGIHAVGTDGTEAFQVLGLGAGQGNDRTIALLGGKFPVDSTPEIRCEPYRVPEQSTRAYWLPWESGTAAGAETDVASPASPLETASTYVFSDVVAGPSTSEPDDLVVSYTVSWSGEDHPGVHVCTFRALAEDGSVVGEFSHLDAWQPGPGSREVPGDPATAVSGEVSCDPERLDALGIADVRPMWRTEGSTVDELLAERADRLEAWAARWSVESMTESQLAGNMWAIWEAMTQGHDEDLTVTWQLADRRHYLCVRLPPEHEFRGGEFCD